MGGSDQTLIGTGFALQSSLSRFTRHQTCYYSIGILRGTRRSPKHGLQEVEPSPYWALTKASTL